MSRDDLVAFVKRNGGNPRDRRQPRGGGGSGAGAGTRAPRKCPNCGKEHKELKCLHPPVDIKDRPCWKCGKKNHVAKNCTEKLAGVNEEMRIGSLHSGAPLRSFSALNDGLSTPKNTVRPTPRKATLDEFISTTNRFSSLSQRARKMTPLLESDGFTAKSEALSGKLAPDNAPEPEHRRTTPPTAARVRKVPSSATKLCDGTPDEIKNNQRMILDNQQKIHNKCCELADARFSGGLKRLNLLERSGTSGEILGLAPAEVTIVVAADSGAVTHVEHIERFGEVDTVLTGSHGATACAWDCADVSRALHSIAKVTGPEHGEGVHEALFTNRRAVVVPAGFVEEILKRATPVLEYNRVGNLYLAEVKLSSFARQGQKR